MTTSSTCNSSADVRQPYEGDRLMQLEIEYWQSGRPENERRVETWPDLNTLIDSLTRNAERGGYNLEHAEVDQWVAWAGAGMRAAFPAYGYTIRELATERVGERG